MSEIVVARHLQEELNALVLRLGVAAAHSPMGAALVLGLGVCSSCCVCWGVVPCDGVASDGKACRVVEKRKREFGD